MKPHAPLLFAVAMAACSCARTVYVPVESARRDSIVTVNHVVDSVILADTVIITSRADTVFRTETRRRDRIRLVRDTIRTSSVDTVKIIVPAPPSSSKESTKSRLWSVIGFGVLVAVAYLLKKRKFFGGCW